LSSTSTNPVQNKAIKEAIDNIPKFSGDYNDLTNAPDISEDGSGNMMITDESGNIIFKADADGINTTAVSINGEAAATEKYVDDAVANIDIPDVDFTGYATETFVNEAIANIDFPETDLTGYAKESYVDEAIADLVNSAPEALNTLGELADALENHEDAYDALLETVGSKATHTDLDNLKEELSESIVSEADEWKVVDNSGNIIFSVDANGAHVTDLSLNGRPIGDLIEENAGTPVDVVQTTGTSETAVMSQKATTTALDGKLDKINASDNRVVKWDADSKALVESTMIMQENGGIVINEGEAIGDYSFAAGTTDSNALKKLSAVTILAPTPTAPKAEGTMSLAFGANTNTISTASIAFGYDNHAGVKGYYYNTIDFTTNENGETIGKIVLAKTQELNLTDDFVSDLKNHLLTTDDTSTSPLDWEVGDYLSIDNGNKYPFCTTIANISIENRTFEENLTENTLSATIPCIVITTTALPFTKLSSSSDIIYPDDRSIFAVSRTVSDRRATINVRNGMVEFG
jgi:hypothetical protein